MCVIIHHMIIQDERGQALPSAYEAMGIRIRLKRFDEDWISRILRVTQRCMNNSGLTLLRSCGSFMANVIDVCLGCFLNFFYTLFRALCYLVVSVLKLKFVTYVFQTMLNFMFICFKSLTYYICIDGRLHRTIDFF